LAKGDDCGSGCDVAGEFAGGCVGACEFVAGGFVVFLLFVPTDEFASDEAVAVEPLSVGVVVAVSLTVLSSFSAGSVGSSDSPIVSDVTSVVDVPETSGAVSVVSVAVQAASVMVRQTARSINNFFIRKIPPLQHNSITKLYRKSTEISIKIAKSERND
jgi:hypothetical protein